MNDDNMAVPLPEIMVFPHRLLSADTTEKLLNRIHDVPHVTQVNVSGEGLHAIVGSGPNKGLPVDHEERKTILVKGEEIELRLLVGRVFVEVDDIDNVDAAADGIAAICEELLPFGFNLEVGRYHKYRQTVTDYNKRRK